MPINSSTVKTSSVWPSWLRRIPISSHCLKAKSFLGVLSRVEMLGTEWSNRTEGERSRREDANTSETEGRSKGRYRVFNGSEGMAGRGRGAV